MYYVSAQVPEDFQGKGQAQQAPLGAIPLFILLMGIFYVVVGAVVEVYLLRQYHYASLALESAKDRLARQLEEIQRTPKDFVQAVSDHAVGLQQYWLPVVSLKQLALSLAAGLLLAFCSTCFVAVRRSNFGAALLLAALLVPLFPYLDWMWKYLTPMAPVALLILFMPFRSECTSGRCGFLLEVTAVGLMVVGFLCFLAAVRAGRLTESRPFDEIIIQALERQRAKELSRLR